MTGPTAAGADAESPPSPRSTVTGSDGIVRCAWGAGPDAAYRTYHDGEWGRPSRDGRHLFELLVLEGAQAGLSWSTILHKREGYRRAFACFDAATVAVFDDGDIARRLADPGIVRNRLKISAAIANARATLELGGVTALAELLWGFAPDLVGGQRPRVLGQIPAQTPESRALSRDLTRRGFRFVGPTICYSFMQATGMVNDHVIGCAAGDEAELSVG